jgi:hypothetical protein
MEYLKYLITNPSKLAWNLLVLGLYTLFAAGLVSVRDEIIYYNSVLVYTLVWIGITSVLLLALYQPYREWLDLK